MASKRDPAPPGRGSHARVCVLCVRDFRNRASFGQRLEGPVLVCVLCVRDFRNRASFGQRLEGPVLDGKVHTHECVSCACVTSGTGRALASGWRVQSWMARFTRTSVCPVRA